MLNFFKKRVEVSPEEISVVALFAPANGEVISIEAVPDPVFAGKMVGDGVGILLTDGLIKAPCDGQVVQIFKTNHAFGIVTKEGLEILVHIGLDTVKLKGAGFERLVEQGAHVKQGDPVIRVDLELVQQSGYAIATPVVITNMDVVEKIESVLGENPASDLGNNQEHPRKIMTVTLIK